MNRKICSYFLFIVLSIITAIFSISFELNINDSEVSYIDFEVNKMNYHEKLGTRYIDIKDNIDVNKYDINQLDDNYIFANKDNIELNNYDENRISINNSDIDTLCKLPGIGIKTATKIVQYRDDYGPFIEISEIKNVSGIGDKKYEKIKNLITL